MKDPPIKLQVFGAVWGGSAKVRQKERERQREREREIDRKTLCPREKTREKKDVIAGAGDIAAAPHYSAPKPSFFSVLSLGENSTEGLLSKRKTFPPLLSRPLSDIEVCRQSGPTYISLLWVLDSLS